MQAGFGSMDSVRRPTHGSVRSEDRRASIVICNHVLCEQLLLLLLRSSAEQCRSHPVCAIYIDKCISDFERVVCDGFLFVIFIVKLIFICFICIFFITLPHRQPRAIFGGFVRLSGERMLLREELIVAEDSPHITMQRITTFY